MIVCYLGLVVGIAKVVSGSSKHVVANGNADSCGDLLKETKETKVYSLLTNACPKFLFLTTNQKNVQLVSSPVLISSRSTASGSMVQGTKSRAATAKPNSIEMM